MSGMQRVKDKQTGDEYSARRPDLDRVEVIDKPAVDAYGRALPAKHKTTVAKKAAASKTPKNGGEPAQTAQEGA